MKSILGNPIVVFFFLVVFSPLGIFLMFTFTDWPNSIKLTLALAFGVAFIIGIVMTLNESAALEAQMTLSKIKEVM